MGSGRDKALAITTPAYQISVSGGICRVVFTQDMAAARSLEALLDACSLTSADVGPRRILFDIRGVGIEDTEEDKQHFARSVSQFGFGVNDRLAGLAREGMTSPSGAGPEVVEQAMRAIGFNAGLFYSLEEAEAWLLRDDG